VCLGCCLPSVDYVPREYRHNRVRHILMQKSKNKSNRKEAKLRNDCEWQKRFDSVLRKIQSRSLLYRPEKIESDITREVRKVREEKRYT